MKTPEQQAKEIVRYDMENTAPSMSYYERMEMVACPSGDWVRYEDHLQALRESSKPVPEGKKYRDGLASACEGLQKYVEYFGPIHEDGCSQDDTCRCVFKPTNEDVSCLCVLAANAKGQRDFEARESALSSQGKAQ